MVSAMRVRVGGPVVGHCYCHDERLKSMCASHVDRPVVAAVDDGSSRSIAATMVDRSSRQGWSINMAI